VNEAFPETIAVYFIFLFDFTSAKRARLQHPAIIYTPGDKGSRAVIPSAGNGVGDFKRENLAKCS
jgi:hypothetical protein